MNNCKAQILAKLASREAHVAVIGLGYVGLPLAVVFAEAGYCVTGVDLDARKVVAALALNGECRSASAPPPFMHVDSGLAADASPSSLQPRCEQFRQFSVAKRLFDVVVSTAALAIFAPLLAVIALVVWLAIGAPIRFKQQRPGLLGRPFTIYKFRTMSDARDAAGCFLPDAERLGSFGRFLRSTSLDELPELINVLRGGENTVGQPLIKAARPMALPSRIVDTDCDKLPVEKSEAQVIQMHGRRSSGAVRTLRTSNAAEWNDLLSKMRQHDFHHLPQYHRVAEQHGEGIARLFAYSENGYTIALPLLLRLVDTNKPEGWTDATSVYGYAGPVASHEWLPESFLQTFLGTLRDELLRARVVSVFSRLHPLIPQQEMLAGFGECVENGQTISIDLSLPEEEQRAHYKKDCRRRLRRLREAGFVCVHDREKRYLPEFVEVYHETMHRAGAAASYFFDRMYFEMLTRELDDVAHLFVVLKDHRVAAAVICTSCGGIVQDHLGGTGDAFLKFSPTRLTVDTVRVWARENGARVFHLGGGVGAQQDSLFEHKASFSDRRHAFFTWRWILQSDVYEELCSEKERGNTEKQLSDSERGLRAISPSFFPAYRCSSEPDTVPAALRAPAPAMAAPDEIQVAQNG